MSEPLTPAGVVWFAHRTLDRRRHLGLFDPAQPDGYFDLGPQDEVALLASNALMDLEALTGAGKWRSGKPNFDVPVRRPSKILCLAKNYAKHAAEFRAEVPEEPVFFNKLVDTLLPHEGTIQIPHWLDTRVDHEIELAVILGFDDPEGLGRKYVSEDQAMELVAGYTVLNDITARRMQGDDRKEKRPWLRCKSFDTFCPIGPWVVPRDTLPWVEELDIKLWVNDELRQDSNTAHMVFDTRTCIAWLSKHTTLRPGDVVAMGTPEGVGPLSDGDTVRGWIGSIGELSNSVQKELHDR